MSSLWYTRLALLLLGVVLVAACSQGESSGPRPPELMQPTSPAPASEAAPPSPTPAQEAALLSPTPTPAVRSHTHSLDVLTKTPASIDHRILLSDVVARAAFSSATATVTTIPSGEGVAPTYRAALELRFTVAEYLKGNGAASIVVEVVDGHTYLTRDEALGVAQLWSQTRNATWDNREAVLFLVSATGADAAGGAQGRQGGPSAETALRFTETGLGGYELDGGDKTWLPASEASGQSEGQASGQTGGADPLYLTASEPGDDGSLPTVSLSELRSHVSAVAATLAKGAGIEGYEKCIESKYGNERWVRAVEAAYGEPYAPTVVEKQIASGLPAGTQFHHSRLGGGVGYNSWLVGPDATRFHVQIVDTGLSFTTARPLPDGAYAFGEHFQFHYWVPCNYAPGPDWNWTVTVTAPTGTVHEAFFDPVAIGTAVGADGTNGVLKPTAFTVGGVSTALQSSEVGERHPDAGAELRGVAVGSRPGLHRP